MLHTEEDLCLACVQAIAAKARVNLSVKDRSHDYTIDGTFHQISYFNGHYHETGFSLDFQLKASINCIIDDTHLRYDLDWRDQSKHYLAKYRGLLGL